VLKCEYRNKIRFFDPETSFLQDEEGSIEMCECGKPGLFFLMHNRAYKVVCDECSEEKKSYIFI
jgi:hypothetical protein